MDRQRRATDNTTLQSSTENSFWADPCDYNGSYSKPDFSKELVRKFVAQTRSALTTASKYKDTFAYKLHDYRSFDALREMWATEDWLKKFPWYREELLPKEKVLYSGVPDDYVDNLVKGNIDEVMPVMYKALKMIVAGYYAFAHEGFNDQILSDETLKTNITQIMHDMRAALCCFSDVLNARDLTILPVLDSEVPDFKSDNRMTIGILLYRDSINYLEYITQVFQKFYDLDNIA